MIHRHLEIPAGTPTDELPSVAILDILERGDLEDWRPLSVAIARAPDGDLARRVSKLIDEYPTYGTSSLWRAWIDRCRVRSEGVVVGDRVLDLAGFRRRAGLTQVELAHRLGISQSDLSKLERRRDVRLSTLGAWAMALGSRLRIVVASDGADVELRVGRTDPRSQRGRRDGVFH